MMRFAFPLLALALGAATCTVRPPKNAPPGKPAPPPPPAETAEVPAGYVLEHFGADEALRLLLAAQHPTIASAWGDGALAVLRRGDHRCALSRQGPTVLPVVPCEPAADGAVHTLRLRPTWFEHGLEDGWVPARPAAGLPIPAALLKRLLEPLYLPDVDLAESVVVGLEARADGSGQAITMELAENPIERMARFDLRRRYGGADDYVGSVKAWGDGMHFQWITKLDGGGAGLRLDGRKLRMAVQAGADWQQGLDQLLRRPGDSLGPFPSLRGPRLILRIDAAKGWTMAAAEKPLATARLLRQLAARLRRWRAPKETP